MHRFCAAYWHTCINSPNSSEVRPWVHSGLACNSGGAGSALAVAYHCGTECVPALCMVVVVVLSVCLNQPGSLEVLYMCDSKRHMATVGSILRPR